MTTPKFLTCVAAAALTLVGGAADVVLSGIKAAPRYPWNGLVDIDFNVQCSEDATVSLNVTRDGNRTVVVRNFWLEDNGTRAEERPITVPNGRHRIVWDAGIDLTNSISHDVKITLDAVVGCAQYMVVDLSGGPDAEAWPVSYLSGVPAGGWSEEYKSERMVFALVPRGSFTMGSPGNELGRDAEYETPHAVNLSRSFYAAVFEVTQRQYYLITGLEPSYFDPRDDRPVDSVTWTEAAAALATMKAKTGLEFRLPTEAEWEYACRGGKGTALYNGLNLADEYFDDSLNAIANSYGANFVESMPVGYFDPNDYGLYDMLGNVSEWCQDGFAPYSGDSVVDPCQDAGEYGRVLRGGDCWSFAYACRSASRSYADPEDICPNVGFRAVLTGTSEGSASTRMDTTVDVLDTRPSPRFVTAGIEHQIAYSPTWKAGGGATCEVSGAGRIGPTDQTGSFGWLAETGFASFVLSIDNVPLYTATFSVLPTDALAEDRSVIDADLTIPAGQTVVVSSSLTIPAGRTMTLAPGAVLKLASGVKVTVEEGGHLVAEGLEGQPVVITHINDDTVGAKIQTDPNWDDRPVYGAYEIVGEVAQNDFTEFRYVAAQPLPATITADTVLRRGRIYTAASTVTVRQGATLTIQPGATLKFASGADLKVNGALVAQGTATENVVFTALNDDDWGGDTDGDSGRTKPSPGAWGHIEVAGSASFAFCRVLYASDMTDEGAVHVVGGTASFDNGEIAHAEFECVRVNSGMFTSKNSVFRDAAIAFGYYGGTGVYVDNAVVADVTEASRGINKHFRNTVFYRCLKFVGANNECRYCAFYNPANYGPQTAGDWTADGSNGCIWGDPKFVDNGLTPYALGNGSVCIDAADGDKAPTYDAFGRPRMNVLDEHARRGRPDAAGVYPDIGIFEADGSSARKANLVVSSLAIPVTASVGSMMDVSYRVQNDSETSVKAGTVYRDTVAFVAADGTSTIEARVFNAEVGTSALSAGEFRDFTRSVQVPVLLGGDWFVRVVVNSARDLLESSYDDNVATSPGAVHIAMASNRLDEETRSAVTAGHPVMLKYDTGASTSSHIVEISGPEGATVRYGFGFTPSAQSSTGSAVIDSEGGKTIVSLPAGQTVYIIVESDRSGVVVATPKAGQQMQILAVSPNVVAKSRASLALDGQLFGEDASVEIASETNPGSVKAAESVKWISPERVLVTCDFSSFDVGRAVLTLRSGGSEAQAAVTVGADIVDPGLEVTVDMPDSLRQGRSFSFRVNYTNRGGADMDAPILRILSPGLTFATPYGEYAGEVKLVALGDRGEDGVLRPGVTYGLDVAATVSTDPGTSGHVDYSIVTLTKTTAGASGRLPRSYFLSGDVNSGETTRVAAKLGETWETFFDGFSKFLTARGAYGLAVADFEVMAHDYARHLLAEVRASGAQEADTAETLREQTAENLASYGGDSAVGTLWLYRAGEWVKLLEGAGTLTSGFKSSWPVVLIAHGNQDTVRSPLVQRLAKTIDDIGLWPDGQKANVIAVDWGYEANRAATAEELAKMYDIASGSAVEFAWMGEISKELRARIGEVEFGFASARDIPAIANTVLDQLQPVLEVSGFNPGKAVFIGWGHGAHLLGAVAAKCAANDRKIGRLVLLEPSGIEQFAFVAARDRYPQAWNLESAEVIESYKTTPWASNGASAGEGAAQILGHFNFNVVPDRDASGKTAYFDGRGIRADNGLIVGHGMLGYLLHADFDTIEARMSRARSLDCVRWFTDTVLGYGVDFEYGGWCGVGWSWMPEGSPAKFALPHENYHRALTNYPHAFHALIRERRRVIELLKPLELDDANFYPWRVD